MTAYPAYRPSGPWASLVDLAQTIERGTWGPDGDSPVWIVDLLNWLSDRFALLGGPRERDLARVFSGFSCLLVACDEEIEQLQAQLKELEEKISAQLRQEDEAEGEVWDEDGPLTEPDDT